ncbi:hypothetical protein V9T40_005196 [Parthenolecanium corni]|uniref:Uncharacterized protein n=1 Tax=Parthenolecanium corni TaxID=536013 RepID=A0AAN9TDE1_9HEMI
MCPNDPNLDTSCPLVQHSPFGPVAKRTRQSLCPVNLFKSNPATNGESSNAGIAMETNSVAAVSSTAALTVLPPMVIPERLLQFTAMSTAALTAASTTAQTITIDGHQSSNLTNFNDSNPSDHVTVAQFTQVFAQFNASLTALAQQIGSINNNVLTLAQTCTQSHSQIQASSSSNQLPPREQQQRLFWCTDPPGNQPGSSDDDSLEPEHHLPPRDPPPRANFLPNRYTARVAVLIDIGSSIAENMTKLMMRKKKIEPFLGENDHRTVCEFLRIYNRNYTSLKDSDIRCEILRNNICNKTCSWVVEEYVVNIKYPDLAEYLLRLYWDEDTRNQVWMNFKQETYNTTGVESFSNYVTSRYYQLRDTKMVSEAKLIKEFQHK